MRVILVYSQVSKINLRIDSNVPLWGQKRTSVPARRSGNRAGNWPMRWLNVPVTSDGTCNGGESISGATARPNWPIHVKYLQVEQKQQQQHLKAEKSHWLGSCRTHLSKCSASRVENRAISRALCCPSCRSSSSERVVGSCAPVNGSSRGVNRQGFLGRSSSPQRYKSAYAQTPSQHTERVRDMCKMSSYRKWLHRAGGPRWSAAEKAPIHNLLLKT